MLLHPGDQLWEYIAGGAGHGDPLDRDPAAVFADVLDGKVSPALAIMAFGVVLTPDGTAVDDVKTKESRERRRAERGSVASTPRYRGYWPRDRPGVAKAIGLPPAACRT